MVDFPPRPSLGQAPWYDPFEAWANTVEANISDTQGEKGDTGPQGPAGEITEATAATLAPGAAATVTLGGTPSQRTMQFGIPRGQAGVDGTDGQDGAAATITGATATSLPAGSAPTVTPGGTSTARTFAFGIPAGSTGAKGDPGSDGSDGVDGQDGAAATITGATATSLAAGASATVTAGGTPTARTFAFGIPRGDKGEPGTDGQDGAAATITGATATSLPAGSAPTVSMGGSSTSRTFEFGIPRGDKGDKGDVGEQGAGLVIIGELADSSELPPTGNPGDAYLIQGNLWAWTGTDWNNVGEIQGPPGDKGDPGDDGPQGPSGTITSATASALAPGATPTITLGGTPSARTMAFGIPRGAKGDPGSDGVDGQDGAAATITGATATSLAAGASATVTAGGTPTARTFAFGIPRGDKGEPGTDGQDGAAATITGATATSLPAGSAPTVTPGGTSTARTFAFGIPAGSTGAKGDPGNQGPSGTITSATASALAPGATPTITLGGTPSARTMAFGIPRGEKGDPASNIITSVNGETGDVSLTAEDVGALADDSQATEFIAGATRYSTTEEAIEGSDSSSAIVPSSLSSALGAYRPKVSTIKHTEASGYSYEVIRVSGGAGSISKVQPAAVQPNGTIPASGLLSPKQMAEESGYRALINCDAYGGTTTRRSVGLHILDGVAYQNFGVQGTSAQGSDLEALLLMRDGSMRPAYRSEGKTAQQYVNEGATASFGYGPILVLDGVAREWWTMPEFSGFVGSQSARSILGQSATGEFILITVEGVSGSYGITGQELTTLALAEGCHIAVNLDGGGSVQTMWMGNVVHPSSDASGVREIMTYIGVSAPPVEDYDSGVIPLPVAPGISVGVEGAPPLSVRQRGGEISMQFAATGSFPPDAWTTISGVIPNRYLGSTSSFMRGVVYGTSGAPMGISHGTASGTISARCRIPDLTTSNLDGVLTYPARNA